MQVLGSDVPSKSQEVVFRRVDEESVFVPIRRSASDLQSIYTTNAVGTRVWELIDGKHSVEEIASAILAEYQAPRDAVRADVDEFLGQLAEAGCIALGNSSAD